MKTQRSKQTVRFDVVNQYYCAVLFPLCVCVRLPDPLMPPHLPRPFSLSNHGSTNYQTNIKAFLCFFVSIPNFHITHNIITSFPLFPTPIFQDF